MSELGQVCVLDGGGSVGQQPLSASRSWKRGRTGRRAREERHSLWEEREVRVE